VAFDQGLIGPNSCGAQRLLIGWPVLRRLLSPSGSAFVAALR